MSGRRIAVMAAGGVGGYFGARLAAAGREVAFVARGTHLDAMRRAGLRVQSALGDVHLQPVQATDDPAKIGPVETVIFAVKLADTERAAEACAPLLKPDTPVFTFQNGVESAARLGAVLGAAHVVPGSAYIASTIAAPGVIRHTGTMARLAFGEADGKPSERTASFLADCRAAGIEAELAADPQLAIWTKFIRLAPFSGLTALTRMPIGCVRENSETMALLLAAIREAVAVARAEGIRLPADVEDQVRVWVDGLPGEMTSSMAHDLAAAKPLELPWLSGAVARLGERRGVPTPVHRFIAQALALHLSGGARP